MSGVLGLAPSPSHIEELALYCLGLDAGIRPHRLEQFILRHQPPRVLQHVAQHGECFGVNKMRSSSPVSRRRHRH